MALFLRTGNIGIKETFGKFSGIAQPELNLYIPLLQKIQVLNAQINQINLQFNVRTKDGAFSRIDLAVQYKIH